jgi:hypothetical protein
MSWRSGDLTNQPNNQPTTNRPRAASASAAAHAGRAGRRAAECEDYMCNACDAEVDDGGALWSPPPRGGPFV